MKWWLVATAVVGVLLVGALPMVVLAVAWDEYGARSSSTGWHHHRQGDGWPGHRGPGFPGPKGEAGDRERCLEAWLDLHNAFGGDSSDGPDALTPEQRERLQEACAGLRLPMDEPGFWSGPPQR